MHTYTYSITLTHAPEECRTKYPNKNRGEKKNHPLNIHWMIQPLCSLLTYDDDFGFFITSYHHCLCRFYCRYLHWMKTNEYGKVWEFHRAHKTYAHFSPQKENTLFALLNPKHTKYEIICSNFLKLSLRSKCKQMFDRLFCMETNWYDERENTK